MASSAACTSAMGPQAAHRPVVAQDGRPQGASGHLGHGRLPRARQAGDQHQEHAGAVRAGPTREYAVQPGGNDALAHEAPTPILVALPRYRRHRPTVGEGGSHDRAECRAACAVATGCVTAVVVVAAIVAVAAARALTAPLAHGSRAHPAGSFSHTDTCEALSLVNGSRLHPLHRSRRRMPADAGHQVELGRPDVAKRHGERAGPTRHRPSSDARRRAAGPRRWCRSPAGPA